LLASAQARPRCHSRIAASWRVVSLTFQMIAERHETTATASRKVMRARQASIATGEG